MTWQDILLIGSAFLTLLELFVIGIIAIDDHAMRLLTEQALKVSRDSLQAQKDYLDIRRKWYERQSKKKIDDPKPA